MKKMLYLTLSCCAILLSFNMVVYGQKSNSNAMITCKTSEMKSDVKELLISELADPIEVVRLETNDNCLIKNIWKVFVTDNYIGILEHDRRPYKLFDRKGKFISQIGSIGQGPNEYISIIHSSIDEANKRVYIMPFSRTNRILCYDFDGKPQNHVPLYFNQLDKASFYMDKGVVTVFSMPISNKKVFAFQQNMKGELIQSIPATEKMQANNYNGEIFTSYNKGVFSVHYTALDTLFHYDTKANKLIPVFRTVFGKDAFAVYRDLPNHFMTLPNIIVDKRTKKATYYKAKNDFLGGMDINYFQSNNDYMVVVCEAFKLREELEKNIKKSGLAKNVRDRMQKLLDSTDDDDNPILVIGKLK